MSRLLDELKNIRVILGSQSPRRQELLRSMGIAFEVIVGETDELVDQTLSPEEVVESIARAKLSYFGTKLYAESLVIVSDTLVAEKSGAILGKPKDVAEATIMLENLSGSQHQVYTAVGIGYQGRQFFFVEKTEVSFQVLESDEIKYYIDKCLPFDKAGSYGIQEWIGRIAVDRIHGSFENVMGLPTSRLYQELKRLLKQ